MRIVADANIPQALELFGAQDLLKLLPGREITPQDVTAADVLLVRSVTRVDGALLDGSAVKFVGTATSGVDHIDLNYLKANEIGFASAHGANADAVTEYVLSVCLAWANLKQRKLADLSAGIIGYGEIGTRVTRRLRALGVDCRICDPPLAARNGADAAKFSDLSDTIKADIVTLHVPLELGGPYPTVNLLDERQIQQLGHHALLINAARGGVVDESALLRHLAAHPSFTAAIDCWANEPRINQELLARAQWATPHIAGYSLDGKIRGTIMLRRALDAHLGRDPTDLCALAPPAPVVLDLIPDESLESRLMRAVRACYDPQLDSEQLKCALQIPQEARSAYFDRIRRDYLKRREFGAVIVKNSCGLAAVEYDQLAAGLEALGFEIGPTTAPGKT